MKKEKICTRCTSPKLSQEFPLDDRNIDGLSSWCRKCHNEKAKEISRTSKGLLNTIYRHQVASSKHRNHPPPDYTRNEFIIWGLSHPDFIKLYWRWVSANYPRNLTPSFDRADDYKGYTWGNFNKWMVFKDNYTKGVLDMKEGRNNKQSVAVVSVDTVTGSEKNTIIQSLMLLGRREQ